MDDDTSNDVEAVETIEISNNQIATEADERPIMLLLKCLIRNKQNTVMTNNQIIEILKQEFDINVDNCHELEVDIYIRIIKKYLKDWPQWEELERMSSKLSDAKDYEAANKVLTNKYKNLKEYLGSRLDVAKPLAKQAVAGVSTEDDSDVVMEVYCTREQLNHLIFRKPRTDLNNTIFNIAKVEPTRISLNNFSFESILNFWSTKISITLPNFSLTRELEYKFNHKLVNKVREEKLSTEIIDTKWHCKQKNSRFIEKVALYTYFYKIVKLYEKEPILYNILEIIFGLLKIDLKDCIDIKLFSPYRQFANKYKYVRFLYVENSENNDPTYDLQLQELMTPVYHFNLLKMWKQPEVNNFTVMDWLSIECTMCKIKFYGCKNLIDQLQTHFNEHHQYEPAWQCSNCKQIFSIEFLSVNRWCHEC